MQVRRWGSILNVPGGEAGVWLTDLLMVADSLSGGLVELGLPARRGIDTLGAKCRACPVMLAAGTPRSALGVQPLQSVSPLQDLVGGYIAVMKAAGFSNSSACYVASGIFSYEGEAGVAPPRHPSTPCGCCPFPPAISYIRVCTPPAHGCW